VVYCALENGSSTIKIYVSIYINVVISMGQNDETSWFQPDYVTYPNPI
jgi:hypothetical protein